MRKTLAIFSFLLLSASVAAQQPQWKFPLAFEDATGAKDTLFFVWDSTASLTVYDTVFGEIPMSMPTDTFQVYVYINFTGPTDSSKTVAIETDFYSMTHLIRASNYILPITMNWDTVVLNNSNLQPPVICCELDNDYFWGTVQNNRKTYNMLQTDTVTLPPFNWGSQNHFPLTIFISREDSCSPLAVTEIHAASSNFTIYPNPAAGQKVTVKSNDRHINRVVIFSAEGKKITGSSTYAPQKEIKISTGNFAPGFYILEIMCDQNCLHYEKIITH